MHDILLMLKKNYYAHNETRH